MDLIFEWMDICVWMGLAGPSIADAIDLRSVHWPFVSAQQKRRMIKLSGSAVQTAVKSG